MRHTGHIRERSPGSFEIRYSLGTDPATGRRRIATTTIRGTREEAEKELRRLLRSLDTGEHLDPNRITVRDWLTTWLAAVRSEVAPKTHERYGEIADHFLAPALGNLQLAKLAPANISNLFYDPYARTRPGADRHRLSPWAPNHQKARGRPCHRYRLSTICPLVKLPPDLPPERLAR